jgi:hypothetical protein
MLKRLMLVLWISFLAAVVHAADAPPSEASIRELLEVTHARQMIGSVMTQMDTLMKNAMQQITQGQQPTPEVQKIYDKAHSDVLAGIKEQFTWEKLLPMYVRIYQKSLTQKEVDGIVAFYKTPAGQALINKIPTVMKDSMEEMNQMMQPMMQRIQQMQQDMVAEIELEKSKEGGG